MNPLLILFCLLCLAWPLVALCGNTKNLPWGLKLSPVFISAIGGFLLWQHLAMNLPVVTDAQVKILNVVPGRLVADLTLYESRSCRMQGLEVYFVDKRGEYHEGKVTLQKMPNPEISRPTGESVFKKSVVVSVDGYEADHFYFKSRHLCAFNTSVDSTFGVTKVPEKFNPPPYTP